MMGIIVFFCCRVKPINYIGILCFDNYDIFDDGVKDLIVGKDDGQIEIYSYNEGDAPALKYSHVIIFPKILPSVDRIINCIFFVLDLQ